MRPLYEYLVSSIRPWTQNDLIYINEGRDKKQMSKIFKVKIIMPKEQSMQLVIRI